MYGLVKENLRNRRVFTLGNVKHLVRIVGLGRGKTRAKICLAVKTRSRQKLKQLQSLSTADLDVIMLLGAQHNLLLFSTLYIQYIYIFEKEVTHNANLETKRISGVCSL